MQINIIQNFFCSVSYVYHLAANPQLEEAKYLGSYQKLPGGSSVHILSTEITLSRSTHQKSVYAVVKKSLKNRLLGAFLTLSGNTSSVGSISPGTNLS